MRCGPGGFTCATKFRWMVAGASSRFTARPRSYPRTSRWSSLLTSASSSMQVKPIFTCSDPRSLTVLVATRSEEKMDAVKPPNVLAA